MSAMERFAIPPPGCMQSHPAHGEEVARCDPQTFLLHLEFVHAHGLPKGQFTTFSNACRSGAHGK